MKSNVLWVALVLGVCAQAKTLSISNSPMYYCGWSAGVRLDVTSHTDQQANALPTVNGNVLFHFDCAQTNDWSITADGQVLRVPSRVGTRYLTADSNDVNFADFTWKGWGWPTRKKPNWVKPPTLTEGLGGHLVLDFGPQGSEHGLVFDLAENTGTSAPSNSLYGFGTVAVVYDSTEGGGFFLGGGKKSGYGWHRGNTQITKIVKGVTDDPLDYSNPIILSHAFDAARWGTFRHDGMPASGYACGFAGQWETIVLQPDLSAGVLDAQGLGLGDTRADSYNTWARRSGGMRIAEAVFYDRTLTDDEVRHIEAYLKQKWFAGAPRGWNGNAAVAEIATDGTTDNAKDGIDVTFAVPANESATLVSLRGGHLESSFTKTGAGTLKLGDAGNYGARLDVADGVLAFERRALPTTLPTNWLARLDAAQTEKMTLSADDEVTAVADVGGHPCFGQQLNLVSVNAYTPKLCRDRLGAGKHAIDFGPAAATSGFLKFATNETAVASYPSLKISGVCSYVAVMRSAGGSPVDGTHFLRAVADTTTAWNSYLLRDTDQQYYGTFYYNPKKHGRVFVDGLARNPGAGTPTPGWHVVAVRAPILDDNRTSGFGGYVNGTLGGCEIAEVIAYDRVLTETEMRDASAFLMNKWFGRVPGDYAGPGDAEKIAVQNVRLGAEADGIDVPAGATVRVRKFAADGTVVKTGAGKLVLEDARDAAQAMRVQDGSVVFAAPSDVSSAAELAARPSIHLDPVATNTFVTETLNGTNFVKIWNSVDFANCAWAPYATRLPWFVTDGLPAGLRGVDFGPHGGGVANPCMVFGRSENNMRAAFVVWRPHGPYAFIFGQSSLNASSNYDFHRHATIANNQAGFFRNDLFGGIYTNGVSVDRSTKLPNDQWILAEFYAKDDETGGLTASALACDRDYGDGTSCVNSRYGGASYGEIVIYDRTLSEREKIATRNYLLKKWFPDAPRAELPPLNVETNGFYAITVDTASTLNVDADEAVVAAKALGDATLTKTGAGTLALRDLSAFTGTIALQEGTLQLTGIAPAANSDAPVTDGRVLHMDATWGVTAFTNAAGIAKVTSWKSKLDDGWTAEPFVDCGDPNPTWMASGLNGLPVLDLCAPRSTNELQALRFKKDGEWARLALFRSVVWVFGSQNGGGALLGGGTNSPTVTVSDSWQRGGSRGLVASDYILSGSAKDAVRWGGYWYKDRVWYPYYYVDPVGKTNISYSGNVPNMSLSGAWDLLEWNSKLDKYHASADGFGFESTVYQNGRGGSSWKLTGRQRLAEVIIYDRILTDAEREQNENYLARKWGLLNVRGDVTNAAAVVLAAGTTLDCGGTPQYVGALGGAGTVAGDVSAGALACDYENQQTLTVTGTFTVPAEGLDVALANFPLTDVDAVRVKLLEAGAFAASSGDLASALHRARFTGAPSGYKGRLEVLDGALWLAFRPRGISVILR